MSLQNLQVKLGISADGVFGKGTLSAAMKYFKLSAERASHFFGQTSHESGGFKAFSENLNYTHAETLTAIFKYDFDKNKDKKISPDELKFAQNYVGNKIAIANFVYANQNGNGNEASGDGWKYRGRGVLQTTGKDNYIQFSEFVKDPEIITNPDLVATKYAFESAIFFFDKNKLWNICDKGVNDVVITELTKRINGGTNGLSERIEKTNLYYSWITKAV